jgi:hypothetical protein
MTYSVTPSPNRDTSKSAKRKSSAGAQHETQLSDCQICSTISGEEEDHNQNSIRRNPLPQNTTEDLKKLACSTDVRDLL